MILAILANKYIVVFHKDKVQQCASLSNFIINELKTS